jgi:general secretion pathway protein J
VVLLRAPYRVSFSYAGVDRVWRDTWREARLPSAVRVLVRDAATGQALAMSSATVVHVNVPAECVRATPSEQCKAKADAAGPVQAPKPAGERPL